MRPFRFGVMGGSGSPGAWKEWARKVEAWGYSTLTANDHLGPQGPGVRFVAPMVGLAFAAAVTTSLRLSTLVMNFDLRHPAVAASEWAALDLLSGGRAEPGFGAGWNADEYRWAGMRFDSAGVRVSRFEEYVQVLRGLWSEQSFAFEGEYFRIDGLDSQPRPVQQPGLPLLIGVAEPRMIRLAGRHAEIVSFGICGSAAEANEKLRILREAAGPRFESIEVRNGAQLTITNDDPRAVAERALARRPPGPSTNRASVGVEEYLDAPGTFIGPLERIEERMYEVRERWGISYFTIVERNVEAAAQLVARLTGR